MLIPMPKTGDNIAFKEVGDKDWKVGRVVGSWKKTSKYKYWKHLLLANGQTIERDFENGIAEWKIDSEEEDSTEDINDEPILDDDVDMNGCFPVVIPRKDFHLPEVQSAIDAEIAKYKSFAAF